MRCTALTALFFAIFSLFSSGFSLPNYMPTSYLTLVAAMGYAAPVAREGAIVKRQCTAIACRVSVRGCLYKRVVS